jgi:hypothetical protein
VSKTVRIDPNLVGHCHATLCNTKIMFRANTPLDAEAYAGGALTEAAAEFQSTTRESQSQTSGQVYCVNGMIL